MECILRLPNLDADDIINFKEGTLIEYSYLNEICSVIQLFEKGYAALNIDIPKNKFKILKKEGKYRAIYKEEDMFVYFVLGEIDYIIYKGKFNLS